MEQHDWLNWARELTVQQCKTCASQRALEGFIDKYLVLVWSADTGLALEGGTVGQETVGQALSVFGRASVWL